MSDIVKKPHDLYMSTLFWLSASARTIAILPFLTTHSKNDATRRSFQCLSSSAACWGSTIKSCMKMNGPMLFLASSGVIVRSSATSASLSKMRQPTIFPSSVIATRMRLPYLIMCSVTNFVVLIPCDVRKCKTACVAALSPT